MTPFDAIALVAMLSAFYPVVSTAALAQARSDRPAYFAGGALVGAGDRLQLGDGRVFLLIWQNQWTAVGNSTDPAAAGVWDGPRIRAFFQSYGVSVAESVINQWLGYWALWGWKDPGYFLYRLSHAQELVDAGKATALPSETGGPGFALGPGALVPADPAFAFVPRTGVVFEPLVSAQLGDLGHVDAALDGVHHTVTTFDPAHNGAALDDGSLDHASSAHDDLRRALDAETIGDVAGASDGQHAATTAQAGTYDEQPPPDTVPDDPGNPPHHKPPDDGNGRGKDQ